MFKNLLKNLQCKLDQVKNRDIYTSNGKYYVRNFDAEYKTLFGAKLAIFRHCNIDNN